MKQNKNYFGITAMLLTLLATPAVVHGLQTPINNYTVDGSTVLEYSDEFIIIREVEGQQFITNYPKTETLQELLSVGEKSFNRERFLVSSQPDATVPAVVAFKEPISETDLAELSNTYEANIGVVRFDSTEGGGQIPYPIDHALLDRWQREISEFERTKNGIKNFQLVVGYTEADAAVPVKNLDALASDPRVLIIDVGPVDFLDQYPEAITIPSGINFMHHYEKVIVNLSLIDDIPPAVNTTNPKPREYSYTTGIVEIEHSVRDDRDLYPTRKFKLDNKEFDGFEIDMNNLTLGSHTFLIEATDDANNIGLASVTFTVIDDVPPNSGAEITAGTLGNENWYITDVTIKITAEDEKSGINRIEYSFDGLNYRLYDKSLLITEDGTYNVYYRAVDNSGNIEESNKISFRIDKSAPLTIDNAPTDWINTDATITLAATDNLSGVERTYYCTDSTNTCEPNIQNNYVTITQEGVHHLRYYSKDAAGNNESIKSTQVKIDKTNPTSTLDTPADWINTDFTANIQATDNLSGVKDTFYCTDQTNTCTPATSGTYVAIIEEGINYARFYSNDNAGNIEDIQSKIVKIDKSPPVTTDNAPEDWQANDVYITLTPTDNFSGVSSTKYCMDTDNTCTPDTEGTTFYVTCTEGSVCKKYVRYFSTDNAGNTEAVKSSVRIKIDKQKPATTDNGNSDWTNTDKIILLTADDGEGSGIKTTNYCVDSDKTCVPSLDGTSVPVTCLDNNVCRQFVSYYSTDNVDNVEDTKHSVELRIDKEDPATTHDADTNWHTSDITVTLTANDGAGSGVADTYYRIYQDEVPSETRTVSANGQPVITYEDDNNKIEFWSLDNTGNEEQHQFADQIKLDKTIPEIEMNLEPRDEYPNTEPLPFTYNVQDPQVQGTPSGILEYRIYIDDIEVTDPTDIFNYVCAHTITIRATDVAGNENQASLDFTALLNLIGDQLFLTPEVLKINPGVLTAHTAFPYPYNSSTIISGTADGVAHDFIADTNIKFRRTDLEAALGEALDTFFEIRGTFSYNEQVCEFIGSDSITEIQA